jgi:hypothetical protein
MRQVQPETLARSTWDWSWPVKTYLIQLLIVLKFYKFYSTPISFMHILVLFSCWAQSDYSLFIVMSWELHRLSIIFNWQFDFSRPCWYSRQNGVTVKKKKKKSSANIDQLLYCELICRKSIYISGILLPIDCL